MPTGHVLAGGHVKFKLLHDNFQANLGDNGKEINVWLFGTH